MEGFENWGSLALSVFRVRVEEEMVVCVVGGEGLQ